MASKGSFFALSGNQVAFEPTYIEEGGLYVAGGAGIYWVRRSVTKSALFFELPTDVASSNFTVVLYIKDVAGDADTYPIYITDANGYLIDGETTLILSQPYEAATLVWNTTGWSQVA